MRNSLKALATTAAIATLTLLTPASSQAASLMSFSECPDKTICVYEDAGGVGQVVIWSWSCNTWQDLHGFSNRISSMWNRSDYTVYLSDWDTYYGQVGYGTGQQSWYVGDTMNDRYDHFKVYC